MTLVGRRAECAALEGLIAEALAGTSGVAVLRGEAGVGKSALLSYVVEEAAGWRVATAVGVEHEMQLSYSGLHQLCAPMLDDLERLPGPQRDALATVFGRSAGPAPDRFLVGLATLTLFAEVAEQQPLVCVIDDVQWLDHESSQIIGFVARRLLAERVALVCSARPGIGDDVFAGLPELSVEGLGDGDARALLRKSIQGPLDIAVRDRIIAESHGNPFALLELSREMTTIQLAGGFGFVAGTAALPGRIEDGFLQRLEALPTPTRSLLLIAAAEPVGDPLVLWRAAERLGIRSSAATSDETDGLLSVAAQVRFRHPLMRSAAYRAAAPAERRAAHQALGAATDRQVDPDRRAWHLALAAEGPDEDVARELEESADRAQARGGLGAAAAFLQRAAELTVDPSQRAERALAAADASLQAGAFDTSRQLVATAEDGALDEFQRARVELVRARVAFATDPGSNVPPLLLRAARRLEPFDLQLARETYLTAWVAGAFAGHLGGQDALLAICRAIQALSPPPTAQRPLDLLLDGLAMLITDGRAAATKTLRLAAQELTTIPVEDVLRWGWSATAASDAVWNHETTRALAERHCRLVREVGALAHLPLPLASLGNVAIWSGDFPGAASVIAESEDVAAATGGHFHPYTALRLLALRGQEASALAMIAGTIRQAVAEGQGHAATNAHWAAAVLYNGLGRYDEAAAAAERATADTFEPYVSMWALPELVEAAARAGEDGRARDALDLLTDATEPCGTDFALGIEARSRALLSEDAGADDLYTEAIDRLSRSQIRPELARAHLLYGEWLRRKGRRVDAREQLRMAHGMLTAIGMEAFAERARRELAATGEKIRKRSPETWDELTAQEEQIARLACDGLSNAEIGAMLFISRRTVEWHLRKVFGKLEISSRRQLRLVLAEHHQPVTTPGSQFGRGRRAPVIRRAATQRVT